MSLMRYDHEATHMFALSPAACECNHANEVANPSKSLFDIQIAKQCLPQICSRIYVFIKISWFLVKKTNRQTWQINFRCAATSTALITNRLLSQWHWLVTWVLTCPSLNHHEVKNAEHALLTPRKFAKNAQSFQFFACSSSKKFPS